MACFPELRCTRAEAVLCSLLILLHVFTATGMSGWGGGCLEGQDVFTRITENSRSGEVVAELRVKEVEWTLEGQDAGWFFLDERHIRLNASADRPLDREVLGPLLMANLICSYEDTLQIAYRIAVEIMNENDNAPVFAENTTLFFTISELTPVNSVAFTVQAVDADKDHIIYSIDQTSPDAEYFKVDVPTSGKVVLSKPLDYETKNLLTVTIHAVEMNTAESYETSANVSIQIVDADDQYPQFLPCSLLLLHETSHICTSPVYTVNVTEGEEDIVLEFSPGPIYAVDGDRGIRTPVSYAILSGDDEGRFLMDRQTGEMRLIRGVIDRITTPMLHLQVMAYQDNDPRKYAVATVTVRILATNLFNPEFDSAEYHGFVTAGKSHASLVNTYGDKVLMLHVQDRDFQHGFNPMMSYTFSPTSNHTNIYQVTEEGLLIARTNQLTPKHKHVIEVKAIDQESGDAAFTTVVIEVLSEGQPVPHSPVREQRLTGCTVGKAFFLSMVMMTVLGCVVYMVMWLKKRQKGKRNPLERGCVAEGKHPNVSLRCFQLVSHGGATPHMEVGSFNSEEYGSCNPSLSFPGNPGIPGFSTIHQDLPSCQGLVPPITTAAPNTTAIPMEGVSSHVTLYCCDSTATKSSPTFHVATVAAHEENLDSSAPVTPMEPPAPRPDTRPNPTSPNSQADPVTSPSSQSSANLSHTQVPSAEPSHKPRVKTPPCSPLRSSPLPERVSTQPPPTPELPPPVTPPVTPPSTSLDHTDQSEHRRSQRVEDEEDIGVPGAEDADKDDGDELESDEE
ncbi:cadherin-related family member 5 [Solea solea]|uniref:cadherin-related family member 5 n=1 Tax=Solea solea TaxID=90069 RepID=UPI00272D900D|nr:cadherin-related family member 5 [Solea solea]XP_058501782.1 cadherin-related family member 5 [Solea solea]